MFSKILFILFSKSAYMYNTELGFIHADKVSGKRKSVVFQIIAKVPALFYIYDIYALCVRLISLKKVEQQILFLKVIV